MNINLQTSVMELLLQYPDLRPSLADAGLDGLRSPDHWPSPAITVELAAHRHRLDAATLLGVIQRTIDGRTPVTVTEADRKKVSAAQHECHCGGH